jgi:hypothetical protein
VNDDMLGGETDVHTLYATFLPNSTYTWHSDRNPAIVYTFRSSADVVGTAPATTTTSTPSKPNAKPTSQDVVGSEATPFRGTLAGAVTAAGRLTVSFRGKSVASLKAGRYTVAVNDKSSSDGFLLAKPNRRPVPVTGTTFLGTRSLSVTLTAGKWLVMPKAGHAVYSIVVT